MNHTPRGHGAVLSNQGLEIHSVQELHHQIEGLILGHPEVVEVHRVRRPQLRCRLGLAPESRHRPRRHARVVAPKHLRPDQLDRGRPGQHAMRGPVDLAHAAVPQQFAELIASHLSRLRHLPPERCHDVRDDDGYANQQVVRVVHQQCVARRSEIPVALGTSPEHAHRIHRDREQAREHHFCPRARDDCRKHQDHSPDPRDLRSYG
jgi:hypothetical protein